MLEILVRWKLWLSLKSLIYWIKYLLRRKLWLLLILRPINLLLILMWNKSSLLRLKLRLKVHHRLLLEGISLLNKSWLLLIMLNPWILKTRISVLLMEYLLLVMNSLVLSSYLLLEFLFLISNQSLCWLSLWVFVFVLSLIIWVKYFLVFLINSIVGLFVSEFF